MEVIDDEKIGLPMTPDQVTAEWLTQALATRYPGVVVSSTQIAQIIWGTATKVRLLLDYDAAEQSAQLPRTMVMKAGLAGPEQITMVGRCLECEEEFYRDWRHHLDINAPKSYFSGRDSTTGQAVVLIEDLNDRAVQFGYPPQPLSIETVRQTLEMLASFHAKWWSSPELETLDGYPGMLTGIADYFFSPQNWDVHMSLPRGRFVPSALQDRERIRSAWLAMQQAAQSDPTCFIHGDAHIGNMYFEPDGRPGFLDWQNIMRGPWAHDVAYFMAGALSIEDRRQNEHELLKYYLDRLTAYGAEAPEFDEAWLRYRRHVIHGFCWVLVPEQMQCEEYSEAMAERYCAAMIDLDSLGALDM